MSLQEAQHRGWIPWFARNGVAANLLMGAIIFLGLRALVQEVPLEVFPEFELDIIQVNVPFRGATPSEVEEGVVIRVEEAIADLDGIAAIRSSAREGAANIAVEVDGDQNLQEMLAEISNRVDAISTFPSDTERPIISKAKRKREVIDVSVFGPLGEKSLREWGERLRDQLLQIDGVSQVELWGTRPFELSIEVRPADLERHGLSFGGLTRALQERSRDIPGGSIKAQGGEILLRSLGQAYNKEDFDRIPVMTRSDGSRLLLHEVATVHDGFEDEPIITRFNGEPAVVMEIYRVGNQSAIEVADKVKDFVEEVAPKLPEGLKIESWRDRSRIVKARLKTLLTSAVQGGVLVFILLTLFLRFRVALWVCVGIPVSFMGAIFLMPFIGVTINIFSLFAFILVLGIVVDDAIVTAESIYSRMKGGASGVEGAIEGTKAVAVPVTFGVLTTMVAFYPLMIIEGPRGKLFAEIPAIVIPVLIFSLIESKLVLPSHLKHLKFSAIQSKNIFSRFQSFFADGLEAFIEKAYQPLLKMVLANRFISFAIFVGSSMLMISLAFGVLVFRPFPRVQSETARATLVMPVGTNFEETRQYIERMTSIAKEMKSELVSPGGQSLIKTITTEIGIAGGRGGSPQSHRGRVSMELVSPEYREIDMTTTEVANQWRDRIGSIPGAKQLTFRSEIGRSRNPIDVELRGEDFDRLKEVSGRLKEHLQNVDFVFGVSDSFDQGKSEVKLRILPRGEHLGLSQVALATQVRHAFFGSQVQRIQRGKDDVRVMIRYPREDRNSIEELLEMRVLMPEGGRVPLREVAEVELGTGFSTINRIDRNRTISVTADLDKKRADTVAIQSGIGNFLDEELASYPDISYKLSGEAEEQRQSFAGLIFGSGVVLFAIYALLAIPLRSYLQPIMVMSVIPLGVTGAILGHIVMGYDISMMSLFGLLALIGVVVNDSLVLVDYVNRQRDSGIDVEEAALKGGGARFRPILLTSLTTFVGLVPLMFETSTQAQFLIPMGISLAFGILFATTITLFLIPINYLLLEDAKRLFRWLVEKEPVDPKRVA